MPLTPTPLAENSETAPVRVFTLGRFLVEMEGVPVRFGAKAPRKPLELLKVLVALGGDAVPVEQLCESLWPDSDGDRAHSSFGTTLSRLRKLVGPDSLELQDGRLSLAQGHCWVDAREFVNLLTSATRSADTGEADVAWRRLEETISLYRGPFLEGEFDPPEILSARERLHGLFLRHIGKFGQFFCDIDQEHRAIELLQKGLEVDDLAEEFYQSLMTCYLNQGRLAEGLSLYQRCRQILVASVGIEPSPETEQLRQAFLAAQNDRAAAGEAPPEPSAPAAAAPAGAPGVEGAAPAGDAPAMAGERRTATVAFFNFFGYRAMTDALDPEEVEGFMSRVKGDAVRIVEKNGGIVNQFVGEEIQALFGIPTAHEDDPSRAARAALELNECVRAIRPEIEKLVGKPFQMHAGINTGLVVTNMGDLREGRYAVLGDTVNTAAGLLAAAKADQILVGPECHHLIEPYFETKPVKPTVLKGREQPLVPHLVIADAKVLTRFEVSKKKGLTPYTGRERELATIQLCLDQVIAGQGQFVTIIGEAGMGKSRLFHEFRESLDKDMGVMVVHGWAHQHASNTPYYPYLNALRRGLSLKEGDSPAQQHDTAVANIRAIDAEMEQYIPGLLHMLSIPSETHVLPPTLKGEALREALNQALAAGVSLRARRGPIIILMENWHWADEASDGWLHQFISIIPSHPILLAINYRPEFTPDWGKYSHHTTIHLHPVHAESTGSMVRSCLGAERLGDGLAAAIHERTGGNPFYVEELCNLLLEEGVIQIEGGRAAMAQNPDSIKYPDTVQAVIRARLDLLHPEARHVLCLASVIGRQFSAGVLEQIGPPGEKLAPILEELKTLELITQVSMVPDAVYTFKHVLTKEVAHDTLLLRERRDLHGQVARFIEARFADQLEKHYSDLAHHFQLSSDQERALHYLELAGDKAAGVFALDEARRDYRAAIEVLSRQDSTEANNRMFIDLNLKWAAAASYAPSEELVTALQTSRKFAEELGDEQRRVQVTYWSGRVKYVRGNMGGALADFEEALQLAEAENDELWVARTINFIGRYCFYHAEYDKGIEHLLRGIAILERRGDKEDVAYSKTILGTIYGWIGEFQKSFAVTDEALQLARAIHDPTREAAANVFLAMVQALAGDWQAARENALEGHMLAERSRNTAITDLGRWTAGYATFMSGAQEAGLEMMSDVPGWKQNEVPGGIAIIPGWLCEMYALANDPENARAMVELTFSFEEGTGQRAGRLSALRALALAAAQAKKPSWKKIADSMEESIRLAEERGARPDQAISRFRYAELLREKGDKQAAGTQLLQATKLFTEMQMAWWLDQAKKLKSSLARKR